MEKAGALTPIEKAAILISSLPENLASEVLGQLGSEEIRKLSSWMSKMGTIPGEVVETVINDFVQMAMQGSKSVSLGKEYAKNLVSKALGEEKAKSLAMSEGGDFRSLDLLEDLDSQMLTDLTRNEHPQTIALILSHLSPEKAGAVLSGLPDELRAEVMVRVSSLERVPPDIIDQVAEMLEKEIESMGAIGGSQLGGVKNGGRYS